MGYVYVNGRLCREDEAMISVFDRGFLYGDGIFETLRAYGGKVFKMDAHLRRLSRSAGLVGLGPLPSDSELTEAVYGLLEADDVADAYVRVSVSRGVGGRGISVRTCGDPTIVIIVRESEPPPEALYTSGVPVALVKVRRNAVAALDPRVKSMSFLNNILAKIEADDKDVFEGIMLNVDGYLAEGTVSNIFIVKDVVLLTPGLDAGILDGITRATVLELAKAMGIATRETELPPDDLMPADECFLTNTGWEVMPATTVDGAKIGAGVPGPVTCRLMAAYKKLVAT